MLALGSSKAWQDVMEQLTGTRKMDATPMVDYFRPLNEWLTEQNKGYDITWKEQCPPGSWISHGYTLRYCDHLMQLTLFSVITRYINHLF